jgi:hypothetical protein
MIGRPGTWRSAVSQGWDGRGALLPVQILRGRSGLTGGATLDTGGPREAPVSGPVPGQQTRSEAKSAVIVYSSNMSTKRPE